LKYSRFAETQAGDGRDQHCVVWDAVNQPTEKQMKPQSLTRSAAEYPLLAANQKCRERFAMRRMTQPV
jgi:hypothetical protein